MRRCIASLLLFLAALPCVSAPDAAAQRALIDATIAAFTADPAGSADTGRMYFLGFAGFGEERVFAEEIKLAADRVGARFGATRQLLLLNDQRDLVSFPLATHDNLRYALGALGRVMDPRHDILFLALSSHGARNAMLEVSNTDMPPTGLSAARLAEMLNASGIRLKVIVISACFSGAFIAPLADNESIVITAAAKNRSSFGCSDDRYLTYFGEAFYRDALPTAVSLRAAFEAARAEIRRREKEERVTPSQPQAHFGPIMETRLEEAVPGREFREKAR